MLSRTAGSISRLHSAGLFCYKPGTMAQKLVSVKFNNPFKSLGGRGRATGGAGLLRRFTSRKKLFGLLLTLLLGAGAFAWGQGKVISVADGDTLTILSQQGPVKVRLYGVDCPESRQSFGPEAADYAADLALFQEVKIQVMSTDNYGRSVALVALPDGRLLNELLLDEGLAWVYRAYCRDPRCVGWLLKEQAAKTRGKGLWGEKSPTPPWKWRQAHK